MTLSPDRFQDAGAEGADALAALLRELVESRSPDTGDALAAARGCVMTPALAEAVKAVIGAPELRPGHPSASRFPPEIFGDGKIGWTSGTAARLRTLAEKILGISPPPLPALAGADAPAVADLVAKVRNFVAGQEHSSTVTQTGETAGPQAAAALQQLIGQNSSGPMALAVVYAVLQWEPHDALPFIRHALRTPYAGAEYYAAIYVRGHQTPEMRQLAVECMSVVRDDDAKRMLREAGGAG